MADRFDKFSENARHGLTLAQEEAQRFNHNYIGTEHLLLGLLRLPDSIASEVLRQLGVKLEAVRSAVEFVIGRGDRALLGEIGLTPRAKKVIELAVDEARHLNRTYIGSEHLLLGLVREGEGIAAGVLESLGVGLSRVREMTLRTIHAKETGAKEESPPWQAVSPAGPTLPEDVRRLMVLRDHLGLAHRAALDAHQSEIAVALQAWFEQFNRVVEAQVQEFLAQQQRPEDAGE